MSFLSRFLKVFIVALLFSVLGAWAFYMLIINGNRVRSDVTDEQFRSTVYTAIAIWLCFVTFISLVLTVTGMRVSMTVPVGDKATFLHRIGEAARSVRYRPTGQRAENLLTFKPSLTAGVLAEKISVQLQEGSAVITAPRGLLQKIQERL